MRDLNDVLQLLQSGEAVLFNTKFPSPAEMQDGYYQRVLAIDDLLTGERERYYVRYDGKLTSPSPLVETTSSGAVEITFNRRNPLHLLSLRKLFRSARCLYVHSILLLPKPIDRQLYKLAKYRILDLHGAVPEETAYRGEPSRVPGLERIEREAVLGAQVLVGVTHRLLDHVRDKYGLEHARTVVLPILSPSECTEGAVRNPLGVIYAGGLQPWQQVDKMLAYVQTHPELEFAFLVPEPEKVHSRFRELFGKDFPGLAQSVSSEDVRDWYGRNSFGLILREDHIVNHAASPTKLAQYLQNGVIPIVDSPDIGDFLDLGYGYVPLSDPLPENREALLEKNRTALCKLVQTWTDGRAELLRIVKT
jgi:hypothetical protein